MRQKIERGEPSQAPFLPGLDPDQRTKAQLVASIREKRSKSLPLNDEELDFMAEEAKQDRVDDNPRFGH